MTKISNQYSLTNVLTADVANGRVGVNNVSPTVALDVTGAGKFSTTVTAQTGFKLPANGAGTSPTLAYNNSLGFGINGTGVFFGNLYNSDLSTAMQFRVTNSGGTDINALTISPTGNVGIGTSSPFNKFTVVGTSSFQLSDANDIRLIVNPTASGINISSTYNTNGSFQPLTFSTSDTERMRITSGGNLLVGGTTDSGDKIRAVGSIASAGTSAGIFFQCRVAGNFLGFYSDNTSTILVYNTNVGNIATINQSNGVYTPLSDINKKKDFQQSNIGLNEVLQLKPTLYRMKTDIENGPKELGFIAQEVNEFIPQAYVETGEGEDKFIGLNQMPIIAALTKAIQELSADLTSAKEEIELLKAKAH